MIINGQTWRRWNSEQNRYTYCYAFGDLHIYHAINATHTQSLLNTIEKSPKDDVLVLVEDVGHNPNSDNALAKTYYENSLKVYRTQPSPSPLHSFVNCCLQRSIPARNVDKRSIHQIAIFFLITRLQTPDIATLQQKIETFCGPQPAEMFQASTLDEVTRNFFNAHQLTVSALVKEICTNLEEIQQYNDGPILQSYYAKIAKMLYHRIEVTFGNRPLHELLRDDQSIFDYYLSLATPEQQKSFASTRIVLCSAEVVDAQTLHEIYQAQHKHKIFLIMGAAHTASLEYMLEKLGYERITSHGPDMITFEQAWVKDPVKMYYGIPELAFDKIGQATAFDLKHKAWSLYKKYWLASQNS